ncbi:hypothetical protein KKF82_06560 [Patescibacteria group bacterium]|nr:hypothetical protein [Patescibacteria group bacterium]
MSLYIVILKVNEKYYIMANDDTTIMWFDSENKAIRFFEDGYNRCHSHNHQSSMSALLHRITFQPSIIDVEGLEYIRDNIAAENPQFVVLHHTSGNLHGITTRHGASGFWRFGKKPRLIS